MLCLYLHSLCHWVFLNKLSSKLHIPIGYVSNFSHKCTPLYLVFNVLNYHRSYLHEILTDRLVAHWMSSSLHNLLDFCLELRIFDFASLWLTSNTVEPPDLTAVSGGHGGFPKIKACSFIMLALLGDGYVTKVLHQEYKIGRLCTISQRVNSTRDKHSRRGMGCWWQKIYFNFYYSNLFWKWILVS